MPSWLRKFWGGHPHDAVVVLKGRRRRERVGVMLYATDKELWFADLTGGVIRLKEKDIEELFTSSVPTPWDYVRQALRTSWTLYYYWREGNLPYFAWPDLDFYLKKGLSIIFATIEDIAPKVEVESAS